jgi:O-antigen/teichoic acid export membrane protein
MSMPSPAIASHQKAALAHGASLNLIGRVVGQGMQFGIQVLLARLLGPLAFGLYSIGWLLVRIIGGLVAPLGLEDAVIRFAPGVASTDSRAFGRLIRVSTGTALLGGGFFGVALLVLAPAIARYIYKDPALAPVLRAFAPAFPLLAGLRLLSAQTRVTQRMEYSIFCEEIVQPIAQCLCTLALFLFAGTSVAAATATSLSLAVSFGVAVLLVAHLFPDALRGGRAKSDLAPPLSALLAFSVPTMAGGLAFNLLALVDQLLVGMYGSSEDVAVYRSASISAIVLTVIVSAFNTMVSSQIAALHNAGDSKGLSALFRATARWGLYLAVPPFLAMCFASADVLSAFGPAYQNGREALIVLAGAHFSHVIAGPAGPMLIFTGSPRPWTILTIAALAANVALNLMLIPGHGVLGAAISRTVTFGGMVFVCLILVKRKLGFWPWDVHFAKALLAGVLTAVTLWTMEGHIVAPPLLRLFAIGLVGSALFWGLLAALGMDEDDKRILFRMLGRLPR